MPRNSPATTDKLSVAVSKDRFAPAVKKKRYHPPNLIDHGDVRDLTLGGTTEPGDSGGGFLSN